MNHTAAPVADPECDKDTFSSRAPGTASEGSFATPLFFLHPPVQRKSAARNSHQANVRKGRDLSFIAAELVDEHSESCDRHEQATGGEATVPLSFATLKCLQRRNRSGGIEQCPTARPRPANDITSLSLPRAHMGIIISQLRKQNLLVIRCRGPAAPRPDVWAVRWAVLISLNQHGLAR